jgi:hypothetical protein
MHIGVFRTYKKVNSMHLQLSWQQNPLYSILLYEN